MAEIRKLAAILATDVVGFSRLTGADEDRTLARLRTLRSDLIDPTIAVHNGRVVKRTGDCALVEFRSVVDAVPQIDNLVERHGLEKIKTTGDAYMVVSGVRKPRPDDAARSRPCPTYPRRNDWVSRPQG